MLSEIPKTSLDQCINEYIANPELRCTFLAQAYIAISEKPKGEKARNNELRNKTYQTVKKYIGFCAGKFVWIERPVVLSDADLSNSITIMYAVERQMALEKPLYDIADTVLEQEQNPINSHDSEHIRRVLVHSEALMDLIATKTTRSVTPVDVLECKSTGVSHDVAQALTGRRIPHEQVGSIVVPSIIAVSKNNTSNQVARLPEKIARNVALHVTSKFDFVGIKQTEESLAYAVTVLADETDIARVRTRPERLSILLSGKRDNWFYLDYFTRETKWEWDEVNCCPKITLSSYVGEMVSEQQHMTFIRNYTGLDVITDLNDMHSFYIEVLLSLLLTPKKINMFRSACKSLFGASRYTVQLTDINDQPFYTFSSI